MEYNSTNGGLICTWQGRWLVSDVNEFQTGDPDFVGGMFWFMNVIGDAVYYSDQHRQHTLCKYDFHQKHSEQIVDQPCYGVQEKDNRLYYIHERDQHIYSCDLFGKNIIKISDGGVVSFVIVDDRVVYATNKGIKQCTIEGKNRELLNKVESSFVLVVGSQLFFCDIHRGCIGTRLVLTTGAEEQLPEMVVMNANTDGTYVYYAHSDHENNIYRFDPVTNTQMRMCRDRASYVHIIGEELLYYNQSEWKKMSLFGGNVKKIWE